MTLHALAVARNFGFAEECLDIALCIVPHVAYLLPLSISTVAKFGRSNASAIIAIIGTLRRRLLAFRPFVTDLFRPMTTIAAFSYLHDFRVFGEGGV